jgi:hypothetical protein
VGHTGEELSRLRHSLLSGNGCGNGAMANTGLLFSGIDSQQVNTQLSKIVIDAPSKTAT